MEGSTYFDPQWPQSGWTDAVNLNFFHENTSLLYVVFSKCEKFEHSSFKLVLKLTDGRLISGSFCWSLLCFTCRSRSSRALSVSQQNTWGLIPYTSNQKQISWVNIQSMRLKKYNLLLHTHLSSYMFVGSSHQWLISVSVSDHQRETSIVFVFLDEIRNIKMQKRGSLKQRENWEFCFFTFADSINKVKIYTQKLLKKMFMNH